MQHSAGRLLHRVLIACLVTNLGQSGGAYSAEECKPLGGNFEYVGEIQRHSAFYKERSITFNDAMARRTVSAHVEGVRIVHSASKIEVTLVGAGLGVGPATRYEFQVGCENGKWTMRVQGSGSSDGIRVGYKRERRFFLHDDGSLMVEFSYAEEAGASRVTGDALFRFRPK